MTPTRSTELYQRRVRLTREAAAVAEARGQVRAAIRDWEIPVDLDIAVLLTSDLATNAITFGDGETFTLAIRCSRSHLRIDVYVKSNSRPGGVDEPDDTQAGHGLVLVTALSTEWGAFRTPAGKAMYFSLACRPDRPSDGVRVTAGKLDVGAVSCEPRPARRPH
jgi:hypothetical protein